VNWDENGGKFDALRRDSLRSMQRLFKPNELQEEVIWMMADMGYNRDMVERLVEKLNVDDVGVAIDLMASHKFVKGNAPQKCYIC
jgi:energy-converting hydrogenase A subunit M